MRFTHFLVALFLISGLRASKIDRAFEALRVYNYFEAKKLFYQSLKRSPVPAGFGLATIYYRTDNPFHNLDSAYKYILFAQFAFQNLNEDKKNEIAARHISDSTISGLFEQICFLSFQRVKDQLQEKPENSVAILNQYLTSCFFSSYRGKAMQLRDDYLFNELKKKNSSNAFSDFLLDWPETPHKLQINYLLEKAVYEEETILGTANSYLSFIDRFPLNRFNKKAQEELFYCYRKQQQPDLIYQFIKKFPDNEHLSEAWKLFFTLKVERYSAESLAEFVLDYPEFPFKNTIIEEVNLAGKKLIKIELNDKYGFIDTLGNLCIPAEYEDVSPFAEGLAVTYQNGKYGYLNKKGQWIIQPQYDEAENFHDGIAVVILNQKPMMIDRNGEIISKDFDEINDFSNGLAVVKKGNRFGAINRLGKTIISFEYEKLTDFINNHAVFYLNGMAGIIDKNNFPKIKAQYDWIEGFSPQIRAKKNGFFGLIGVNEEVIFPFEFDRIERVDADIFLLVKDGNYGFGHRTGCLLTQINNPYDNQLLVTDLYSSPGNNSSIQYMKITRGDEIGIIDQNGKWVVDPGEFDEVSPPHSDLIRVLIDDFYTFYDLNARKSFKQKFDEAENFHGRFAVVEKKGKSYILDKSGNIVFSEVCESIERLNTENMADLFLISKNGLKGLLDENLRWKILPEFQEISFDNPEYFVLTKENKKMVFYTKENKMIWSE